MRHYFALIGGEYVYIGSWPAKRHALVEQCCRRAGIEPVYTAW
jgi:hypothetical protein